MATDKETELYRIVAEQCVTPARYGAVALSEVTVENLGGLYEDDPFPSIWN